MLLYAVYASYARLILNSFALKSTTEPALLEPFYKESYSAAMTYLTVFSAHLSSPSLGYAHNSSACISILPFLSWCLSTHSLLPPVIVTVAYVSVFTLRLCSLDPSHHPYIEAHRVLELVRAIANALGRAGAITPWRNGAASSYAPYLRAILEKVESGFAAKGEQHANMQQLAGGHGNQAQRHATTVNGCSLGLQPSNLPTARPSPFHAAVHSHALGTNPEALSFVAGPSGVQTDSTLHHPVGEENILQGTADPSFPLDGPSLDGVLNPLGASYFDTSLFGDMSVFLDGLSSAPATSDGLFWPAERPTAANHPY